MTSDIIKKFKLNDPDYQIEQGKILKADQLTKNTLRNMTRYDKQKIKPRMERVSKKKELTPQLQMQIIFQYFNQNYLITSNQFQSYDQQITLTLFSSLKVREQKKLQKLKYQKDSNVQLCKRKQISVNDRLQLFNGDISHTVQFFQSNPGYCIYFQGFVQIFHVYIQTLRQMNQIKRSNGIQKYLKNVKNRINLE